MIVYEVEARDQSGASQIITYATRKSALASVGRYPKGISVRVFSVRRKNIYYRPTHNRARTKQIEATA